jgi:RNA polymerase-associated protein RTF1
VKDINAIRTGHSIAEKFCFYPNFEEVIIGTYSKIRVSRTEHRMVKIDALATGKPYTFGESKITTDKYFTLSQPGKDRKNFQFGFLSDEPIKPEEFLKYKEYVRLANADGKRVSLPSVSEVEYKLQELKKFSRVRLEGSVFDEYMKKKSKFNKTSAGSNVLSQKLKIKQQLDVAQDRNDFKEIQRLTKELNEVSNQFDKVNTSKLSTTSATAKISERNRKLNNVSVRQAELAYNEKKRSGNLQSASDPFSRLTTRARMYYQETKKIVNDKAKNDAIVNAQKLAEKEQKEKELLKFTRYRALGEFDNVVASVDFKFDLSF